MNHLRLVEDLPAPTSAPGNAAPGNAPRNAVTSAVLDGIIENNARRYYGRTWKPGAPLWDELPHDAQHELITYVEPFVKQALADALATGYHQEGNRS